MTILSKFKSSRPRASLARGVYMVTQRVGWASIAATVPVTNAYAQGGTDPAVMLNNICDFILGPFGQTLAIIGIIAIGLSWMFGRASLGLIAGVIGGIVIMFGASFLGQQLTN